MTAETIKHLDNLKNSKIVNSELYHLHLSNLCEAIKTISGDAISLTEMITKDAKNGRLVNENLMTKLEKDLYQIDTLSDTIYEKLQDNDYTELDNLFFQYKNPSIIIQ